MNEAHRQGGFGVRFDWGLEGVDAVLAGADVAVVVDVLSFTTTLTLAVEAGITVWPYRWDERSAPAYAAQRQAVLAVRRSQAEPGQISLSPASIAGARGVTRLVLPSPNGATIAARLAATGVEVLAACLRNASAVADRIAGTAGSWNSETDHSRHAGTDDSRHSEADGPRDLRSRQSAWPVVAVIAAGERWPGGGLRPAVEDLWGAGAVLARLRENGREDLSPEAHATADAYLGARHRLPDALFTCASGGELIDVNHRADVALAAAVGASSVVPHLTGECFPAAHRPRRP